MGIFREGLEPKIDENGFHYLGIYHPFRVRNYQGGKRLVKNPKFDHFSRMVLNLKSGYFIGVQHFLRQLESILNPVAVLSIAVVPTHDARVSIGIGRIATELAIAENRIDASICLNRFAKLAKMARGGRRGQERHSKTIRVIEPELVQNRIVLLLDDVTTTGASLCACKKLLSDAGARDVVCLAVGKTALDNPSREQRESALP